jgi:predicted DNA-binding transcriptional regulator AlpA
VPWQRRLLALDYWPPIGDNVNGQRLKLQDYLNYAPRAMSAERADAYLDIGSTKFRELVSQGILPQPINLGGCVRWDRVSLDAAFDDLKEQCSDPATRNRQRLDELIEAYDGKD